MGTIRKRLTLLILVVLTIVTYSTSEVSASGVNVMINGSAVSFTQESGQPFIDSANRTQVPLRQTMEAYGCNVSWDNVNKVATVEKDGITVKVPIGKNYIIKNGESISIDTSAQIVAARTYLPIRAVLEAFGANVDWNSGTHQIIITKADGQSNNSTTIENATPPILLDAIEPVIAVKESYDGTEYLDLTMDYSSVEFDSINSPILKLVAHNTGNKTITAFEFTCKLYDDFDRPAYKIGTTDNTFSGIAQNTTLYGSDTDMKDTAMYYNFMNNYVDRNESSILAGRTTVDKLQADAINKMNTLDGFYKTNIYEFNLVLYETASQVDDFKLLQVKFSDGTTWTNK